MNENSRIGFEIKTITNLIKRQFDSSNVIKDLDNMTGMHGWIIGYLYNKSQQGDVYQRDLEQQFSIRRSTATKILQLMEKNGLIIRQAVDFDARLKKLVFTEKAIAIHQLVQKEIDKTETRLTKGLTQQEKDTLLELLEKIKNNLR